MSILVNVVNQKMYVSSTMESIVAGSQQFVKFRFNLSDEWDGLLTFAQFRQNGVAYNQYLDEGNAVYLPAEIVSGACTLMLYGSKDKVIGTTNYLTLKIDENILVSDAESTDISESLYTQLVSKVDELSEKIVNSNNDLSNFSLGVHTDGFLYIFYKGKPIGSGVSMPSGAIGDVVGNVDSENNIIVTGSLADGTYTVKYEMEDGTTIDIGELVLDSNVYHSITNNLTNCVNSNSATQVISGNSYSATITAKSGYELSSVVVIMGGSPVSVSGGVISIASVTGNIVITAVAEESGTAYTNLLPLAVDASGNAFVGTNGEKGYKTGYRINSRGAEVAASGVECTGFMPYTDMYDTIYVKDISLAATETHNNLVFYDSSKAHIKNLYISEANGAFVLDGDTWKISPSAQTILTGVAYFRFCAGSITDATIVTINEEIV